MLARYWEQFDWKEEEALGLVELKEPIATSDSQSTTSTTCEDERKAAVMHATSVVSPFDSSFCFNVLISLS